MFYVTCCWPSFPCAFRCIEERSCGAGQSAWGWWWWWCRSSRPRMSVDVLGTLWPVRNRGSVLPYVHRNRKAYWDGQPRTATSTFTQVLNEDSLPVLTGCQSWECRVSETVGHTNVTGFLWNWYSVSVEPVRRLCVCTCVYGDVSRTAGPFRGH